ncbi:hypothetical protein ACI1MP_37530 (plasmid) [Kitasatospora griseola]|uniref:hypothetical protein n=1 Tax=Kitasatospora griseola TaxID=2064 RepID=UPI0038559543
MSDIVHLDADAANHIAKILTGLADLVDPEVNEKHPLTGPQLLLVTGGHAISDHPGQWAAALRDRVATITGQLGEHGAEL